jgi:hypothetical protein
VCVPHSSTKTKSRASTVSATITRQAAIPPRGTVVDFVVFALALIGLRLVIMWVVNNTRGSVLMAILTPASWNTFYSAALIGLFPARSVLGSYLNLTIAACLLAVVLVALTRGRLGPVRRHPRAARALRPKSDLAYSYSPECVEGEFSEVHIHYREYLSLSRWCYAAFSRSHG